MERCITKGYVALSNAPSTSTEEEPESTETATDDIRINSTFSVLSSVVEG